MKFPLLTTLGAASDYSYFPAGILGLIIGFFLLALTVAWALFPFLVLSKFNELLKVQRETLVVLRNLDKNLATDAANGNAALTESIKLRADVTKTLQWMVDNWPGEQRPESPPGSPKVYQLD
jgi:hypothetical protein